jgi:hypothetical protein
MFAHNGMECGAIVVRLVARHTLPAADIGLSCSACWRWPSIREHGALCFGHESGCQHCDRRAGHGAMLPMRDGVTPEHAMDVLREVSRTASKVLGMAGGLVEELNGYRKWAAEQERRLREAFDQSAMLELLQTLAIGYSMGPPTTGRLSLSKSRANSPNGSAFMLGRLTS